MWGVVPKQCEFSRRCRSFSRKPLDRVESCLVECLLLAPKLLPAPFGHPELLLLQFLPNTIRVSACQKGVIIFTSAGRVRQSLDFCVYLKLHAIFDMGVMIR